jgi:hypothetical protein
MWFFLLACTKQEVHRSKLRTLRPPGCRSPWEMLRSMLKSGTKWQCVYFGVNITTPYASHAHRNQQVPNRLLYKDAANNWQTQTYLHKISVCKTNGISFLLRRPVVCCSITEGYATLQLCRRHL